MQIKNKLFPYPILDNYKSNSTFKNSNYKIDYEIEEDNEIITFKNAKIVTDNQTITNLINNNKAKACLIVECPDTIYREAYSIGLEPRDILIKKNNIIGNVAISGFIYANDIIENYNDIDFVDEYKDYSFEIEKFDVMAIDNGEILKIDLDEKIDKKISSIFSIIKDEKSTESMEINFDRNRIQIYIPSKEFSIYDRLKNNDNFNNIFFSIFAIPALTQALIEIKNKLCNGGYTLEDIEFEYNWFISIEKAYKKINGIELNDTILLNDDINRIAQSLLNFGTIKAIDDIPVLISDMSQDIDEGD